VDIALLLPHETAKRLGSLYMTDLHAELEQLLNREVDLINLRQVSTVLQKMEEFQKTKRAYPV
jgi:predicted nucleotidyltransferase